MSRFVGRGRDGGQALVEFSLAIMVFIVMVVAIFDLGRGVYMFNGVAEASRELARVTSVHVGNPVGTSVETVARLNVQRSLTPGMGTATFSCTDLYGAASTACGSGDYVKVTVPASYTPLIFLGMGGPVTLSASSSIQIP